MINRPMTKSQRRWKLLGDEPSYDEHSLWWTVGLRVMSRPMMNRPWWIVPWWNVLESN